MTVEELIIYGKKYTSSAHAKMLLASYLEVNPLELLTILDRKVEEETISLYKKSLEALKENRPMCRCRGWWRARTCPPRR